MKSLHVLAAVLLCAALSPVLDAQPPSRFGGRGGFEDGGDEDDRGGFRGRGGSRGRGGFSGRGGFDPSEILRRLDRNDNGVLDPDEQQGPAGFLIRRLQQSNPEIEAGRPIPLDQVRDAFGRMRRGRGGDRDEDEPPGRDEGESREPPLLVPGFGVERSPVPLPGFGPSAELWSLAVTEQDEREAAERMRHYDRDRDGFLSQDELRRSRLFDDAMVFDRNRDGRLSASELARRHAHRRGAEQRERQGRRDNDRDGRRRSPDGGPDEEIADPFGGRNSYRAVARGGDRAAGLPGWFADKDRDRDGQVAMAEYTDRWSEDLVAEFFRFDLNRDGLITASECAGAVRQGAAPPASAIAAPVGRGSDTAGQPSADSGSSGGVAPGADAELVEFAEQMIERYDQNGDGVLTADEWEKMLIPPAGADADQDGRITAAEYAAFRQQ